jgi:hypothetical protein
MRKALGLLIILIIVFSFIGCSKAPEQASPIDDKAEISELMHTKFNAYNDKNVEKYAECFDPGSNDIGSIKVAMQTLFKDYEVKLEQIGYVVVDNVTKDTAEAQYAQKMIVTKGKGLSNNTVKAVDRLKKVKGKWKIETTQITDQYSYPNQ